MIGFLLNLLTALMAFGTCVLYLITAAVLFRSGRPEIATVFVGVFFLNFAAFLAFATIAAVRLIEHVRKSE